MIDKTIETILQDRANRIEAETRRIEKLIPAWAHQYLRVRLGEIGSYGEDEFLAYIETPTSEWVYIREERLWWFPLIKRTCYYVNPSILFFNPGQKYYDLREAFAKAEIRGRAPAPKFRSTTQGD